MLMKCLRNPLKLARDKLNMAQVTLNCMQIIFCLNTVVFNLIINVWHFDYQNIYTLGYIFCLNSASS